MPTCLFLTRSNPCTLLKALPPPKREGLVLLAWQELARWREEAQCTGRLCGPVPRYPRKRLLAG